MHSHLATALATTCITQIFGLPCHCCVTRRRGRGQCRGRDDSIEERLCVLCYGHLAVTVYVIFYVLLVPEFLQAMSRNKESIHCCVKHWEARTWVPPDMHTYIRFVLEIWALINLARDFCPSHAFRVVLAHHCFTPLCALKAIAS